MKIIVRILIILSVVLVVSGAVYLVFENTDLVSASGGPGEDFKGQSQLNDGEASAVHERSGDGGDHNSFSLSRGVQELGASLVKIGGITLAVVIAQYLFNRLRRLLRANLTTA